MSCVENAIYCCYYCSIVVLLGVKKKNVNEQFGQNSGRKIDNIILTREGYKIFKDERISMKFLLRLIQL